MSEQLPPEAPSPEATPEQWGFVVFMTLALLGTAAICGKRVEHPVWLPIASGVAASYLTALYFAWRARL